MGKWLKSKNKKRMNLLAAMIDEDEILRIWRANLRDDGDDDHNIPLRPRSSLHDDDGGDQNSHDDDDDHGHSDHGGDGDDESGSFYILKFFSDLFGRWKTASIYRACLHYLDIGCFESFPQIGLTISY